MSEKMQGWARLIGNRKAHFFKESKSLCSRWLYLGDEFKDYADDKPSNCMACRRKLQRMRKAENEKMHGV